MMGIFDKTFWQMLCGFMIIVGLGLFGIYLLTMYRETLDARGSLTAGQLSSKV